MNNFVMGQLFESISDLEHYLLAEALTQLPFIVLFYVAFEVTILAIFENEIVILSCFFEINYFNNITMIEASEDLNFWNYTIINNIVKLSIWDHFDGYLIVCRFMLALMDCRICSTSNLLYKNIFSNFLQLSRLIWWLLLLCFAFRIGIINCIRIGVQRLLISLVCSH